MPWRRFRRNLAAYEHRFVRLPCGLQTKAANLHAAERLEPGGRGRIRTFVARKERQIYSLLVLATHPPVPETSWDAKLVSRKTLHAVKIESRGNTKRTRVKRHQPVQFENQDPLRLIPLCSSGGAGGGI